LELPSGKRLQKAIENGPVEIVDFPSYKMGGSFQFAMLNYQRVKPLERSGAVPPEPVPPGRWNFCRRGGVQELDPHLQGASRGGMVLYDGP